MKNKINKSIVSVIQWTKTYEPFAKYKQLCDSLHAVLKREKDSRMRQNSNESCYAESWTGFEAHTQLQISNKVTNFTSPRQKSPIII